MIYPLDYGYIPGTVGGDGDGVDVFVGSANTGLTAALITHDLGKGVHELKQLWNLAATAIGVAHAFLSKTRCAQFSAVANAGSLSASARGPA